MKIHLFKSKKEFKKFEIKNTMCFTIFYLPLVICLISGFDSLLWMWGAVIFVIIGVILTFNQRFFSNCKIKVGEKYIEFENENNFQIMFPDIKKIEVLFEDQSFKTPYFISIWTNENFNPILMRIDKFDFKRPKKQFGQFKSSLPNDIQNKIVVIENNYISTYMTQLGI